MSARPSRWVGQVWGGVCAVHPTAVVRSRRLWMLFSALQQTVGYWCFPYSILFHFTSLRDADLSNMKHYGDKCIFKEFLDSKHSCQNMLFSPYLMIFYWDILGINLNLVIWMEWRRGKGWKQNVELAWTSFVAFCFQLANNSENLIFHPISGVYLKSVTRETLERKH